jgi:hypothetical protein
MANPRGMSSTAWRATAVAFVGSEGQRPICKDVPTDDTREESL